MSRALTIVSVIAFLLLGYLYLQTVYAAWLHCPDKIQMNLIPKCVEGGV